jgi:hypothetical protein
MTPEPTPSPASASTRARVTSRVAISAPAGLAVLLVAGAVAFGHDGLFPRLPDAGAGMPVTSAKADPTPLAKAPAETPEPKKTEAPDATAKPSATAKPDASDEAEPTAKPDAGEGADPAKTPAPKPDKTADADPNPAPQPPSTALTLSVLPSGYASKVQLGWTRFAGDGFEYYKVVQSADATATWPASADDETVAAISNREETGTRFRPPCGTTFFYRVFAVRHGDHGYEVLAASNTVSAKTTCEVEATPKPTAKPTVKPTPKPEPTAPPATQAIALQAAFADGGVQLSWSACANGDFNAYKVVRSKTNASPTYPENDGTELIAAIGDPSETWFTDGSVASGETWFYRVVARADGGNGTYIACASQVVSVAIP